MTISQRTVVLTAEHLLASRTFAETFLRYLNCSPAIQRVVVDLVKLVKDEQISEKEREGALRALAVTLFSYDHGQPVAAAAAKNESEPQLEVVRERLGREEAAFADNVKRLLQERKLTQAELAERVGLSQPAISMMLARKYRPQRRTVRLIAQALGVAVTELWPGLPAEAPKPSSRGARRDHLANGAGPVAGPG